MSNVSASQFDLFQTWTDEKLIINQLQLSLAHHQLITDGLVVNLDSYSGLSDTLIYCQQHDILIQAWAPTAGGYFSKLLFEIPENKRHFVDVVQKMAWNRGVAAEVIALAWLLKHPALIQPIIGTTNLERIKESVTATEFYLSREEWYSLSTAAIGDLP